MIQEIVTFLKENGYDAASSDNEITTKHIIEDQKISIIGILPSNFPYTLPKLFLSNRSSYKSLAHVGWEENKDIGIICEGVTINRNIDYSNPGSIYLKALNDAINIIINNISNTEYKKDEIIAEFTAHWRFYSKTEDKIINFVEQSNDISQLEISMNRDSLFKAYICIKSKTEEVNEKYSFYKRLEDKKQLVGKGIYIPFNEHFLPPEPHQEIDEWWKKSLSLLSESEKTVVSEILRKNKSKDFWILSSLLLKNGNYGWFCLRFRNSEKTKVPIFLDEDYKSWEIIPYTVKLHNRSYLKPRASIETAINNKTIVVVGCGSVGAEITDQIICLGIERIILVDFDTCDIENVYKHYLGGAYLGFKKTEALKYELLCKYPFLTITTKYEYLKDCIDEKFLSEVDGIIVATGDPTAERFFNQKMFEKKERPWIIYTWVEGHGVGGHAIYIHNHGKGCLNCLYRNVSGEKSLNSIQNFILPDQKVAIDISGCGTHFLPYSRIDAIQTSILASRLTLMALNNQLPESCRTSWKGPNPSSLATSYRYRRYKSFDGKETLYWKNCDVCN